jgi:hypothetical protein
MKVYGVYALRIHVDAIFYRNYSTYCRSQLLYPHNNFEYLYPDIAKEWNYHKNKNIPNNYAPRSNQKL